jgi:hypothetical protein
MRARRTTSAVAVVAALAAGHAVTSRVDVTQVDYPPFVRSAALGGVAHLSYADVEVTDVRPAQYLAPPFSDALVVEAAGVWVLVSMTGTATREPTLLLDARLEDARGRFYRSSTRSDCALLTHLHTGVPVHSVFCFDVPPGVLAGLHFVIARGSFDNDRLDGDDLADVDLGITRSEASGWARTTTAYGAETEDLEPIELQEISMNEEAR